MRVHKAPKNSQIQAPRTFFRSYPPTNPSRHPSFSEAPSVSLSPCLGAQESYFSLPSFSRAPWSGISPASHFESSFGSFLPTFLRAQLVLVVILLRNLQPSCTARELQANLLWQPCPLHLPHRLLLPSVQPLGPGSSGILGTRPSPQSRCSLWSPAALNSPASQSRSSEGLSGFHTSLHLLDDEHLRTHFNDLLVPGTGTWHWGVWLFGEGRKAGSGYMGCLTFWSFIFFPVSRVFCFVSTLCSGWSTVLLGAWQCHNLCLII